MKKKFLSVIWLFLLVVSSVFFHAPVSAQNNCSSASSNCMALPTPKSCPLGFIWSLAGTGLAHCVAIDPICTGGTILDHDTLGNPSCIAPPTCSNGALNYPVCNAFPTCSNGALNYPICNAFPTCANGATDYPTCTAAVGGANLGALPTLVHEVGSGATAQLETYGDGTWRILRMNCGNEETPGWTAWEAWSFCKETYTYGNLLLPGSNPSDFEISRTDQYRTLGRNRGVVNDPVCASWQNLTAQNKYCYQIDVSMQISGNPADSPDYSSKSDASLQFTINIRRKSNPSEVWSTRIIYGASFTSGTQCPYKGFCYG